MNQRKQSWFSFCILVSSSLQDVLGDVIVETVHNFKPISIYEDEPARFGDALPENGMVGYIVKAQPELACDPIAPPPFMSPMPHGVHWIAMIRRSESQRPEKQCTFEEKVKTAMRANYSAAIVYNYRNDQLIPMGGNTDDVIPSVFIGYSDAVGLMASYAYDSGNKEYVVRITDNGSFDINAYLLPFAIVVGICFLIMLAIMIFKCIQDRRRERRHRLPKSSLKKIPTKKFVAGDEEHYETCCICLDDYVLGDKLRILPCGHAYHQKCIDPWLLKNKRVCPQCRKKVFASGEVPPSDTESETEDERRPLLGRHNRASIPAGTFNVQSENPFRRAVRRIEERRRLVERRRQRRMNEEEEEEDSEGASSSTEEEGGPVRVLGNQLLAEVHIEQPAVQRSESPTFERVGERRRVTIVNVVAEDETASRDMEDSNRHNEQEVNDDSNDNEDGHSNSNTVVV